MNWIKNEIFLKGLDWIQKISNFNNSDSTATPLSLGLLGIVRHVLIVNFWVRPLHSLGLNLHRTSSAKFVPIETTPSGFLRFLARGSPTAAHSHVRWGKHTPTRCWYMSEERWCDSRWSGGNLENTFNRSGGACEKQAALGRCDLVAEKQTVECIADVRQIYVRIPEAIKSFGIRSASRISAGAFA